MKQFAILLSTLLYIPALTAQPNAGSEESLFKDEMLKDENARVNYSVGYQIGGDFKRQDVQMNAQALLQGIEDGLKKDQSLMSEEEMRTALIDLKKRILALQQAEKAQKQKLSRDEGLKFLAENSLKSEVKTLESGLQYKVLKTGSGITPKNTDTVSVHYRGTLIDGTEFDSSSVEEGPAQFRVDNVISAWTEALQLMHEGDKWQLFVPPDLAYGERGPLADRTLIFDVELLKVN